MTSPENLRRVVEWGMSAGHSVLDISEGLDMDYMTIGAVYMQIKAEQHAADNGRPARYAKKFLMDERARAENERAFKDPRYRNWLKAKRGAGATLRGKL